MRNAMRSSVFAAVCLAGLVSSSFDATAATYPNNVCVGSKLKAAGNYCRDVLKAWAVWDRNQDTASRDAKLGLAATKLSDKWSKAESVAFLKGTACTETTASAADMRTLIDGALGSLIGSINGGLDLGDKSHARCGSSLLAAAANRCRSFLVAESVWIRTLDKDPQATKRNLKRSTASAKFTAAWAKATSGPCPTGATEGASTAALDDLTGDVIFDSTVSPGVSEGSFDQIVPTAVQYEKRTYSPVCSRGTPYSFFVKRGTVNKLVMYYQGGGACWDYFTCEELQTFDSSVQPGDDPNGDTTGFADASNPANPFRDWNVVFVSYCSGDVHLGDAQATYTDTDSPATTTIEHRGFVNAKVAEKWAREHFVNPEQVFVTGSSAGAYGALLHGAWLHRAYPASDFAVLGDAGNGVITEDFRANNFPSWNVDANLPPDIGVAELTVPEATAAAALTFPNSRWAHYTSAFDGDLFGQTGFYNVMLNPGDVGLWLTWWEASCEWNSVMRAQAIATQAAAPLNYRYYIGSGSRHTMWGSDKVYTDTTGGVPTIVDWIDDMLADDPGWSSVEAANSGLLLAGDPRPSPLAPPFQQVGPDVVITCP